MAEPKPRREYLSAGELIPDTTFHTWVGASIPCSALRGRSNIVLLFLCGGRRRAVELAAELIQNEGELHGEDAMFFAVLHGDRDAAATLNAQLEFPGAYLCYDDEGEMHRRFGALSEEGYSDSALYITDRWGEVYCAIRELEGDTLPSAQEILASLRHLNIMCEECDPGMERHGDAA